MALELGNLVVETTSTELTGDLELNGAAANRARFRDALADGAETFYFVTDGAQREWGIGTLTDGAAAAAALEAGTAKTGQLVDFTGGWTDYATRTPAARRGRSCGISPYHDECGTVPPMMTGKPDGT